MLQQKHGDMSGASARLRILRQGRGAGPAEQRLKNLRNVANFVDHSPFSLVTISRSSRRQTFCS
jgi:hypothetical protein